MKTFRTPRRGATRVQVIASLPVALLVLLYALTLARRKPTTAVALRSDGFRRAGVLWWEARR